MPYFFILPGFGLYVGVMIALVAVTFFYRPIAWIRPYLLSVLLWSSIGFIVCTIAYALVVVAAAQAMNHVLGGRPSVAGGIIMGMIIFVGPFIAAAGGLVGGAAFGIRRRFLASGQAD